MVDLSQRGMKNIIKYSGLNELNLIEQTKLKNVAEKEYETIKRSYHNIMDLAINIKVRNQKKKKYSIHARIEGPSKVFSAESSDWDITNVTRDVLTSLNSELKKSFKEEGKKWRGIGALIRKYM